MNNIIKKLEKELEFAKKMQKEYSEKMIHEPETRLASSAMYDFYIGQEEALTDAINIVKESK